MRNWFKEIFAEIYDRLSGSGRALRSGFHSSKEWVRCKSILIRSKLSGVKRKLNSELRSSREWIRNRYASLRSKFDGWKQRRKTKKAAKLSELKPLTGPSLKPHSLALGAMIAGALALIIVIGSIVGATQGSGYGIASAIIILLFFFLFIGIIVLAFFRKALRERKKDEHLAEQGMKKVAEPTPTPAPATTSTPAKRSSLKTPDLLWNLLMFGITVCAVYWLVFCSSAWKARLYERVSGQRSTIGYQPLANAHFSDHKCANAHDDVSQIHEKRLEVQLTDLPEGCFTGFIYEPEYWVGKTVLWDTIGDPATCWNALQTWDPDTRQTRTYPPFTSAQGPSIQLPSDTRAIRFQAKKGCGIRGYVNVPVTP